MKSCIVVSRKWNNPQISIFYDYEEARICMDARDFIKAIADEAIMTAKPSGIKSLVNMHFPTKEQLTEAMLNSLEKVEREMKDVTAGFPPPFIK